MQIKANASPLSSSSSSRFDDIFGNINDLSKISKYSIELGIDENNSIVREKSKNKKQFQNSIVGQFDNELEILKINSKTKKYGLVSKNLSETLEYILNRDK